MQFDCASPGCVIVVYRRRSDGVALAHHVHLDDDGHLDGAVEQILGRLKASLWATRPGPIGNEAGAELHRQMGTLAQGVDHGGLVFGASRGRTTHASELTREEAEKLLESIGGSGSIISNNG